MHDYGLKITLTSTESIVSFSWGLSCCTQTKEVTLDSVFLLKATSLFSTSTNNKSPKKKKKQQESVTKKETLALRITTYMNRRLQLIVFHQASKPVQSPKFYLSGQPATRLVATLDGAKTLHLEKQIPIHKFN